MFKPKTLAQIKEDMLERVGPQSHPMDVRRACERLQSLDGNHWAKVWSEIARPYEETGQKQEKMGNKAEAERNYMLAYNYYRLGRFAVPNAPDKKVAFRSSVANFVKASRFFEYPVESLAIPFAGREGEGKDIPVYIQKPRGKVRPGKRNCHISHGYAWNRRMSRTGNSIPGTPV
jgi:esterase FrsA